MKLTRFQFIACLCLSVIFSAIARAEDPNSFDWWNRVIETKPLTEIATLMTGGVNPAWPEVRSVRQEIGVEEAAKISLVKKLHGKLKQSFDAGNASPQMVKVYSKISSQLQDAGGYSNLLLSDSINRVVLFHITDWLVRKSRSIDEIKAVFNEWIVPSAYDPRVWLERFQDDDPTVKVASSNFHKIKPGVMFFPSAIGIQALDVGALDRKKLTFSHLLENPSVLAIMWRFAGTEISKVVNVRGFIAFIEKGGISEELDQKDIGPFEKRMGEDMWKIKYPPFDHRYLGPGDIGFCYDIHKNPRMKADILDVALN
jgi:hypothetical protein